MGIQISKRAPRAERDDVTKLLDLAAVKERNKMDAVIEKMERQRLVTAGDLSQDVAAILEREEKATLTPEKFAWARFELQYKQWVARTVDLPKL